jgi:uncharacterized protein YkwD
MSVKQKLQFFKKVYLKQSFERNCFQKAVFKVFVLVVVSWCFWGGVSQAQLLEKKELSDGKNVGDNYIKEVPREEDKYLELEREIINQLNQIRVDKGLQPLEFDSVLKKVAGLKLQDMLKHQYFSHTSPEGLDAWHWFKEAGYNYKFAGENLATNFTNATDVTEAWMQSKSHRENILFPEYREVAVAVGQNKDGKLVAVESFGKDMDEKDLASVGSIFTIVINSEGVRNDFVENGKGGEIESKQGGGNYLQTSIVPVRITSSLNGYNINVNDAILLIVGMFCFILIVNVWVLEKEDEKILAQVGVG